MTPSTQDASEVVPWLTSAATIVYLQKWLKTRPGYQAFIQAMPGADKWAHWLVAGVASLIASLGIHVVWDWDLIKGGQAVLTIPGFWDLVHGVSDWWRVYIMQHMIHGATTRGEPDVIITNPPPQPTIIIPGAPAP